MKWASSAPASRASESLLGQQGAANQEDGVCAFHPLVRSPQRSLAADTHEEIVPMFRFQLIRAPCTPGRIMPS